MSAGSCMKSPSSSSHTCSGFGLLARFLGSYLLTFRVWKHRGVMIVARKLLGNCNRRPGAPEAVGRSAKLRPCLKKLKAL